MQEKAPDLVVLDIVMPRMDGYEMLAHMRSDSRLGDIPVIVVTAKDLSEEEQRTRLDGFVERVLQKGAYSKVELLQEVRDLVVRYAAQQRTEHPPAEIDA